MDSDDKKRLHPPSILEVLKEMFGADAQIIEVGGVEGKTENFGQHTETNTPFKVGDVIVEASGRSGHIAKSRVFGDLYGAMESKLPLCLDTEEIEDLEFPVTVVARDGDPSFSLVVDRKKSGKFKVRK